MRVDSVEWEAERRDALAWLEMNSHDKGKEGSSAKNYNLCFLKIRIIRFCNLSSSLLPIWYLSHLVSMFPILPSSVNLHMTLDYSRGPRSNPPNRHPYVVSSSIRFARLFPLPSSVCLSSHSRPSSCLFLLSPSSLLLHIAAANNLLLTVRFTVSQT